MATYNVALLPNSSGNHQSGYSMGTYAFDNNLSTAGTQTGSSSGTLIPVKLNTSALQPYIDRGATITAIRAKIYMSGGASHSIRLVTGATTSGGYTDCGDGNVAFTAVEGWNTIDFPVGKTYAINNISKLLNGDITVRLYTKSKGTKVYEIQLEVECYIQTITITTQVSPSAGGTISAGGIIDLGTSIPFTATPNEGYEFSHWLFNGVPAQGENPLVGHHCSQDTVITAVFKKIGNQSSVFCGTKRVQVYCGTKKVSVYCGTKKLT
jgi:hypothetical protein